MTPYTEFREDRDVYETKMMQSIDEACCSGNGKRRGGGQRTQANISKDTWWHSARSTETLYRLSEAFIFINLFIFLHLFSLIKFSILTQME